MMYIGFDTSNYTTSIARFDGIEGKNCSKLLDVKHGELGLRQSDAVFSHIKRLPDLADALFASTREQDICAIGVSTRPRAVEGSYMPCFLAGVSAAKTMASALHVPCYEFSHQQGHVAAALWSAGRLDLMKKPHLAWHLSGGTTELLYVQPDGNNVSAERIGGSSDISAGQIMDRTGKMLELNFPSGKELDQLSRSSDSRELFRVKSRELSFSLSGLENKISQFYLAGNRAEDVANYAIRSVAEVIAKTTDEALRQYPGCEIVFSGGVASNSYIRTRCQEFSPVFAEPMYSTDNAMGIAILTWMQEVAD